MNTSSVLLPDFENYRTVTDQAIQQPILHFAEGLIQNQQNRLLKVIELIAGPTCAQDFIWFLNEAYRSLHWQLPALADSQAIYSPVIRQWFDLWLNAHSGMSMRWPVAADHQVSMHLSHRLCERLTLVMGNAMTQDFAFIESALSIPETQTLSWSRFLTQVERWYGHAIKSVDGWKCCFLLWEMLGFASENHAPYSVKGKKRAKKLQQVKVFFREMGKISCSWERSVLINMVNLFFSAFEQNRRFGYSFTKEKVFFELCQNREGLTRLASFLYHLPNRDLALPYLDRILVLCKTTLGKTRREIGSEPIAKNSSLYHAVMKWLVYYQTPEWMFEDFLIGNSYGRCNWFLWMAQGNDFVAFPDHTYPVTRKMIHFLWEIPKGLFISDQYTFLYGRSVGCWEEVIEKIIKIKHSEWIFNGPLSQVNQDVPPSTLLEIFKVFSEMNEVISDTFFFLNDDETAKNNLFSEMSLVFQYLKFRSIYFPEYRIHQKSYQQILKEIDLIRRGRIKHPLVLEFWEQYDRNLSPRWNPSKTIFQEKWILNRETYRVVELTSIEELEIESDSLDHCVRSYFHKCLKGECTIWSLRAEADSTTKRLITIQVNPDNQIVQAKGCDNRKPDEIEWRLINSWANSNHLTLTLSNS